MDRGQRFNRNFEEFFTTDIHLFDINKKPLSNARKTYYLADGKGRRCKGKCISNRFNFFLFFLNSIEAVMNTWKYLYQ